MTLLSHFTDKSLSCILTLIAAILLLQLGLNSGNISDTSIKGLWQMGYGAVTAESMITWAGYKGSSGLLFIVLVANAPQVLLSFLFLTYNGLYTCMLLTDEWNGYVRIRFSPRLILNPPMSQKISLEPHLGFLLLA